MRIDNRKKYDRKACMTRPERMFGHFVNRQIHPGEIHTFYVNEQRPASAHAIGKHLAPLTRRITQVDVETHYRVEPFHVLLVETCIPNEQYLRPSYETEGFDQKNRFSHSDSWPKVRQKVR